jgi:hypothetical protein
MRANERSRSARIETGMQRADVISQFELPDLFDLFGPFGSESSFSEHLLLQFYSAPRATKRIALFWNTASPGMLWILQIRRNFLRRTTENSYA